MTIKKRSARMAGLLFLAFIVIGAVEFQFRGLSSSLIESPDFLSILGSQVKQMKWAIMVNTIGGLTGIGVTMVLFPIIKQLDYGLAIGYVALWILNFAINSYGNINHLTLLSLGQVEGHSLAGDPALTKTMGYVLIEGYFWAHYLSLIVFNIGAMLFNSHLFKFRLIPRSISGFGLFTATLALTGVLLSIFDYSVSMMFYSPNGIAILLLGLWLTFKGMKWPDA